MASGGTFRATKKQCACVDKRAADHNGFLGHGRCEAFEHLARWRGPWIARTRSIVCHKKYYDPLVPCGGGRGPRRLGVPPRTPDRDLQAAGWLLIRRSGSWLAIDPAAGWRLIRPLR